MLFKLFTHYIHGHQRTRFEIGLFSRGWSFRLHSRFKGRLYSCVTRRFMCHEHFHVSYMGQSAIDFSNIKMKSYRNCLGKNNIFKQPCLWANNVRFDEKTTVLNFQSNPLRGSDRAHDKCIYIIIYKFNAEISMFIYNATSRKLLNRFRNIPFLTCTSDTVYSLKKLTKSTLNS